MLPFALYEVRKTSTVHSKFLILMLKDDGSTNIRRYRIIIILFPVICAFENISLRFSVLCVGNLKNTFR